MKLWQQFSLPPGGVVLMQCTLRVQVEPPLESEAPRVSRYFRLFYRDRQFFRAALRCILPFEMRLPLRCQEFFSLSLHCFNFKFSLAQSFGICCEMFRACERISLRKCLICCLCGFIYLYTEINKWRNISLTHIAW